MAKRSKKQRAADRFLDVLQQRKEDFAAIEDSRALAIRQALLRTRRQARQLVVAHQKQFARKGHYLIGVVPLKQAQETVQDIDSLMRRNFTQINDRLISMKTEAFEAGVWDFDVASQKLPGNIRGRIAGTFSQIMPEAAYAAAEHPVMGIGPGLTFNGIRAGTEQRVRTVLTSAVLSGASIPDVTATLDQALNVSVDAAERIARTGLNAAYNDAHKMIYDANSDIFAGYRWSAVMDDRVSPICVGLDGQFWPLGSTPPGPPAHWNCRSLLTPVFRDPALNQMMMEDTVRVRNYTADGKEKSGWIKNKVSAQDWLRKQPTAVTHRVTGSRVKNQLFRSGAIDMEDIVGPDLLPRADKAVLRRAWSKNPTDKTVAKLAHTNGVHRAPKWDTILKEDAALARKQPYDQPVSLSAAEAQAEPVAAVKVSPERMAKWKEDLAVTEEEMGVNQETIKELRKNLRTAPANLKGTYTRSINQATADYARLRNKKRRISKRIKEGGGPGPVPLPSPVVSPKVARLEAAWQETVDELTTTRKKLAAARAANKTKQVVLLRKDEARLINKRWRRWKRLPPDSQTRLKTGVKPRPPKPEVRKVDPKLYQDRNKDKAFREALVKWRSDLSNEERDVLIGWQELLQNAARIRKNEVATQLSARAAREVKLFKQALDKAPPRGGTVFRGITTDSKGLQKLLQGDDLIFKSSASSSRSEKIARGFAEARPGERVVMELKTTSSVDITDIARKRGVFEAGQEQIIRKGTRFKIVRIERRGNFTYVFGEEIQVRPVRRLPTLPKKLTAKQKFSTGVKDVEKTNKRIVELRTKASPTLGDTQELKALQAARTREMNKLRALRRANKTLPDLPPSTRLPQVIKPKIIKKLKIVKPKVKPRGAVRPEQIQVKFSPKVTKLQLEVGQAQEQLSKVQTTMKELRLQGSDLNAKLRALRGQRQLPEYKNINAALTKWQGKLSRANRELSTARLKTQSTRRAFSRAAVGERGEVLGQIRKPKFVSNADKAISRAKAELDALGYDLASLRQKSMNPTELLQLMSEANGQGFGVPLTPIRQRVYDNFQQGLTRIGQWTPEKQQRIRLMLTSMDESLLKDHNLKSIFFQTAPEYRASAHRGFNSIKISPREEMHTIAHEFGHHLQYRNSKVERRVLQWQRERTKDDVLTLLYKGTRERTKKDKFWTDYVGRVYSDGGRDHNGFQEGISMGLQTFIDKRSAAGWGQVVNKDPDHMYLMWAMLRGY